MTILRFTGFDGLVNTTNTAAVRAELEAKGYFFETSGNVINRVAGRNPGGYALRLEGYSLCAFGVNSAGNLIQNGVIGAAIKANTAQGEFFTLTDQAGNRLICVFNADGSVRFLYDPAGSANDIINVNVTVPGGTSFWRYYELRWTSSIIELAVDNFVVYTKTQTNQAPFGKITIGGFDCRFDVDDFYIADDANFRGDNYSRVLTMTGTSSNTGIVTGAADAHTALTSLDGDTSYVAYANDGEKTLLTLSDIADNPVTIHAVGITSNRRKSDTGSVTESLLLKTASEQTVGGSFAGIPFVYAGRQVVAINDPHDASAWTKAKVNAMEVGIKRGE